MLERLQSADGPVTIVVQRPQRRTIRVRKSGFRSSRVTRLSPYLMALVNLPPAKVHPEIRP